MLCFVDLINCQKMFQIRKGCGNFMFFFKINLLEWWGVDQVIVGLFGVYVMCQIDVGVFVDVVCEDFVVVVVCYDSVFCLFCVQIQYFVQSIFGIQQMVDFWSGWVCRCVQSCDVVRSNIQFFCSDQSVQSLMNDVVLVVVVVMYQWVEWFFGYDFWQNNVVIWVCEVCMLCCQSGCVSGVNVICVGQEQLNSFGISFDWYWFIRDVVCVEEVCEVQFGGCIGLDINSCVVQFFCRGYVQCGWNYEVLIVVVVYIDEFKFQVNVMREGLCGVMCQYVDFVCCQCGEMSFIGGRNEFDCGGVI